MRLIDTVVAKTVDSARRRNIDAWILALSKAEARARARSAADKTLKPRYFLINYRVASDTSITKGTEGLRRGALVEIIESLNPVERHLSTSTWLVRLHIQKASDIRDLLTGPLDADRDGLHVTNASRVNSAAFGATNLQY